MRGKLSGSGIFWLCLAMVGGWVWAAPAQAACPNRVSCTYYSSDLGHVAGTIEVPTCYKLIEGCRPWHCEGALETNREYWTAQCMQRFPLCTAQNGCMAMFPGALNQ